MFKSSFAAITAATAAVFAVGCDQSAATALPDDVIEPPGIRAAVLFIGQLERPFVAFIPCANGGVGEVVEGTERFGFLVTETRDRAGGTHQHLTFEDRGTSGVGQITGDVYRRVGATVETMNFDRIPFEETALFIFDFHAPGRGNDFKTHDLVHVTVTANGVTADVLNQTVECK